MKYYRDTYAEHPDDRVNIEYTVPLDSDDALVTLNGLYDQVKGDHDFEEFRYVENFLVQKYLKKIYIFKSFLIHFDYFLI